MRRNQQPAAAAVVAEADPANHAQDAISVVAGVFQPSQSKQGRALGWNQAICLGMEGPAASARAECAQGSEPLVDEEIVGAIHRPGQHQISASVVKDIAGQLDRVDRGGAGGIERKGDAAQAQGLGEKVRGQARHEAVARVNFGQPQAVTDFVQPESFREARQRGRGIGKVAYDHAGVRAANVDIAQGLTPGMKQPVEKWIEGGDLFCRNREAMRIEDLVKALHVPAAIVQRPILSVLRVAGQDQ